MRPLSEETRSRAAVQNADARRQKRMEEVLLLHQEEREGKRGGIMRTQN